MSIAETLVILEQSKDRLASIAALESDPFIRSIIENERMMVLDEIAQMQAA